MLIIYYFPTNLKAISFLYQEGWSTTVTPSFVPDPSVLTWMIMTIPRPDIEQRRGSVGKMYTNYIVL